MVALAQKQRILYLLQKVKQNGHLTISELDELSEFENTDVIVSGKKNIVDLAHKQRHLFLLEKVKSHRRMTNAELEELSKYEGKISPAKQSRTKKVQARKATYDQEYHRKLKISANNIFEHLHPRRNVARYRRAKKSLKYFLETYFPKAFNLQWSEDHLTVINHLEEVIIKGGLFGFAMPRGSGKTTLSCFAALWAVLFGYRRYVCLIGSAFPQATSLMESLQAVLLSNELLHEDFPFETIPFRSLENNAHKQKHQRCGKDTEKAPLTHVEWGTDKLVFANIENSVCPGSIITVASLDGNIRGQRHTTPVGDILRPDLVLVDDPQTRESAKSPSQTKQRMDILNGDVLYLGGPGKKISGLLTCTKIYDGDLADQILDHKKNPDWRGEKMKMVYKFPDNMKLWDEYNRVRTENLQAGKDDFKATEFYKLHRSEMDRGAKIAWEARHNPDELSAVQHAMNLFYRDQDSFMAEYQNDPVATQDEQEAIKPDQVAGKINGRPRGEVPLRCQYLTAFIDVHDKILYHIVCAWEEDFTGYVIDYGTYPDQRRSNFTQRTPPIPLSRIVGAGGVDAIIHKGLEVLAGELMKKSWTRVGGASLKIERLLIDSGYKPHIVESVRHKLEFSAIMASMGKGIKAANPPMSAYIKKPGERYGHHWMIPNVNKTREFPHVKIDTNYWKTFSHEKVLTPAGDAGNLTIFGKDPGVHRLFAEHVAGAEYWVKTEGQGRVVYEWFKKPGDPDNHWFDCLVGNFVAASMCGCKVQGQVAERVRKKIKLSAIQQQNRAGMSNVG